MTLAVTMLMVMTTVWNITDSSTLSQEIISCLRFQQPSCNIDDIDIDIDNGDVDDDNGGAVGHHRQEEEERAINYLSFEVSTTAAAADSFPALFSFSKQKNICLSHFYSLTPRPPSATLPLQP